MAVQRLKPKNDFVFSCLFGDASSKMSLIALLNAILRPDGSNPIVDLTIIENKQLVKRLLNEKTGRLDIRAELTDGEQINIEMQMVNRRNMVHRTLFYMAKLFVSSIKSGDSFRKLKKTVTINLLNFELFAYDRFHSTYHFYEDHEERTMLTDLLEVHFIEFPKFDKAKQDITIPLHRWLLFMDEKLPEQRLKELVAMDPQIEKAQRQLELLSSDDDVRRLAEALEDAQREWVSSIEDSREEGEARGKAEGIREIAINLLAKGMDVRFVSEVSGMSLQQVRELAASLKSR